MHGTTRVKVPLTNPVLQFPNLFQNFSLLKNPILKFNVATGGIHQLP
jgi:hypothetical protein